MPRQTVINLDNLTKGTQAMPGVLKKMGYTALRPGQEEPVTRLMMGQDVLAILPTGGGKTAIYAATTLALEHKTVVFSPLVALMQDQVQSLNMKGVRAAAVNSSQADVLNISALQQWGDEQLDVLLVAPERMESPQFAAAMKLCKPSVCAVDEAHCVSAWSHNFRPSYTKVGKFIEEVNPDVVLAITATATNAIVNDIKKILGIENCAVCKHLPPRGNIKLHSRYVSGDALFATVCNKVREIDGPIIIYCPTVRLVSNMTEYLADMGESVTFYHGQMTSNADKAINQDEFMSDRKRIMVATNAFGMGIDKPNIRGIIHIAPPGSVEAISQETGRAARDGKAAEAWMYCTPEGMETQQYLFTAGNPKGWEVEKVYRYLQNRADKKGNVYVTVEDIRKDLRMDAAQGALNMLVNTECITRFTPSADMRQFFINEKALSNLTNGTQIAIIDAIKSGGLCKGKTARGWDDWEVDMAYVVKTVGKVQATITKHIGQLSKDGYIQQVPKFRGKVTHIEHPPTEDDLKMVEFRYEAEKKKLSDVVKYLAMPDKDKQEYITHYFDLEGE